LGQLLLDKKPSGSKAVKDKRKPRSGKGGSGIKQREIKEKTTERVKNRNENEEKLLMIRAP
jgi:hypothetical protein